MKNGRIAGTGSYVPETIWKNEDLEKMVETSDIWIRERTGIGARHIAGDKVEALEFRVRDNCRFIDVPIKDLNIRKGIIIAYVTHKGVSKVATGDTRIQLSDTVIIISKVAGLRDINDLLS